MTSSVTPSKVTGPFNYQLRFPPFYHFLTFLHRKRHSMARAAGRSPLPSPPLPRCNPPPTPFSQLLQARSRISSWFAAHRECSAIKVRVFATVPFCLSHRDVGGTGFVGLERGRRPCRRKPFSFSSPPSHHVALLHSFQRSISRYLAPPSPSSSTAHTPLKVPSHASFASLPSPCALTRFVSAGSRAVLGDCAPLPPSLVSRICSAPCAPLSINDWAQLVTAAECC